MNPAKVLLTAAVCLISTAYSQHSFEYKNLPDNVFCEYVGNWVNRADKLSPGFRWNIEHLCQDGEYVWENPGMFCNSLTSFYGNGESWCSAYGSCQVGAFPDSCEVQQQPKNQTLLIPRKIMATELIGKERVITPDIPFIKINCVWYHKFLGEGKMKSAIWGQNYQLLANFKL